MDDDLRKLERLAKEGDALAIERLRCHRLREVALIRKEPKVREPWFTISESDHGHFRIKFERAFEVKELRVVFQLHGWCVNTLRRSAPEFMIHTQGPCYKGVKIAISLPMELGGENDLRLRATEALWPHIERWMKEHVHGVEWDATRG